MGKAGDSKSAGDTDAEDGWRNIPTPCWSLTQKADKSALASKVSRIQFDATTEQLNHMMQELVAKMSGQEQDWQKLLDKLLAEMDSKVRAGEDAGGVGWLSCHRGTAVLFKDRFLQPPHHTPSTCCLKLTWCPSPSWTAWSWTR